MNTIFPYEKQSELMREVYDRNANIDNRYYEEKDRLEKSKKDIPYNLSSNWVFKGAVLGGIIGFFICTNAAGNYEGYGSNLGPTLGAWVVCIIIGCVFGRIIAAFISDSIKKDNDYTDLLIENKRNDSERSKEFNLEEAERKLKEYEMEFEKKVQKESVRFADSALTKDVVEWMIDGFCRAIKSADRRSFVETIRVPFAVQVFSYRITCDIGEYDFELHRCANISTGLEQAALSRAIATEMQVQVMMRSQEDISGTSFFFDTQYKYKNSAAEAIITYSAPNGYYKSVKTWDA